MKKIVGLTIALSMLLASSVHADGQKIFKKKGCTSCHHPSKDQLSSGMGPSLAMISAAYKGNKDGLVVFFSGKGEPIVAPEKFSTMKSQLRNTKRLKDAEKSDLADFILSH